MELTIETLADGVTKVNLAGRFDILGAQEIDLPFSVVCGSRKLVIVDLEQVSFLASMGIRTIVMGAKAITSKGGRIALLKPTSGVEEVLTSTAIDTLIPVLHDLNAAIGAVSS
jgi:anti-sigma B factor antagonist